MAWALSRDGSVVNLGEPAVRDVSGEVEMSPDHKSFALLAIRDLNLWLKGHTDSTGSLEHDQQLLGQRAVSVGSPGSSSRIL